MVKRYTRKKQIKNRENAQNTQNTLTNSKQFSLYRTTSVQT